MIIKSKCIYLCMYVLLESYSKILLDKLKKTEKRGILLHFSRSIDDQSLVMSNILYPTTSEEYEYVSLLYPGSLTAKVSLSATE